MTTSDLQLTNILWVGFTLSLIFGFIGCAASGLTRILFWFASAVCFVCGIYYGVHR